MLQRKQSVYLLLGSLSIVAMLFFDGIWETPAAETLVWYVPSLIVTGIVVVVVALVAIFMYGNRLRQQQVVVAVQVLTLIFMVLLYGGLFLTGVTTQIAEGAVEAPTLIGLVLPILAYVFFYLARKGIQADIDLVRSMDRLR